MVRHTARPEGGIVSVLGNYFQPKHPITCIHGDANCRYSQQMSWSSSQHASQNNSQQQG